MEKELYHHGVKGMRWGVRRYQKKDGSLTLAGKNRYVRDAMNTARKDSVNESRASGRYNKIGGLHKANQEANIAAKKAGKQARKDLAESKKPRKESTTKKNTAKIVAKGAEVASKMLMASVVDDVFYGGVGKKIAKETIIQTGRAAVTAFEMARGGYDIKWYDKYGRRVG